jgi:dedicated sortase system histidine kinase
MEHARLKNILPFPSIRTQLLIISLVVLILPWVGIQTLRDMENLMRQQQVHNLLTTATTVSNGLSSSLDLIEQHNLYASVTSPESEIVLSELSTPVYVDGFADDWPEQRIKHVYTVANSLQDGISNSQISFTLSATEQNGRLLLLLDVDDNKLFQAGNPATQLHDGDRLLLGIGDPHSSMFKRYVISSNAPGWLRVIPVENPQLHETRIQAELQIRGGGYTIELSMPRYMAGNYLSIVIVDRDNDDSSHYAVVGNTPIAPPSSGYVVRQSEILRGLIQRYRTSGQKITVVDRRGYILSVDGDYKPREEAIDSGQHDFLSRMHRLFILADSVTSETETTPYRMRQNYVLHALDNQSSHVFTRDINGSGLLSVAVPLLIDDQPGGALIIQQSTDAITDVRYRALWKIMLTSMSAIAVIALVLLLYATLLIRRVTKLNRQLKETVSDDGRLRQTMHASILGDEIGELNRGISSMIDRLQAYQQYLETMAGKLSHELRTPLTVVQSSLENLRLRNDTLNDEPLMTRADEGLNRLKMILSNLTEASRLENALKTTEMKHFNLPDVIAGCVNGYQQAFPDARFEYHAGINTYELAGSADLIAQLMDKLVSNAIDFHQPDTPIVVSLNDSKSGCRLCIQNTGEPIPERLMTTLFDSMVSARTTTVDTPHLGLGLYIVRLIANFHGATPSARSEDGTTTICIDFIKTMS